MYDLERKFYRIWSGIKTRCLNPKNNNYKRYGGRGISVCERWLFFEKFKNDMYDSFLSHVYRETFRNTTIDRINNNEGYNPSNCRWATYKVQRNNQNRVKLYELYGISKTLYEWSILGDVKLTTLKHRMYKQGFTLEYSLLGLEFAIDRNNLKKRSG